MKKTFSKITNKCKITFTYPEKAESVAVAGDFNGWNPTALPMKKGKAGFSATVELDPNRDYEYRFWVNNERWENDNTADGFTESPYADAQNCLVRASK